MTQNNCEDEFETEFRALTNKYEFLQSVKELYPNAATEILSHEVGEEKLTPEEAKEKKEVVDTTMSAIDDVVLKTLKRIVAITEKQFKTGEIINLNNVKDIFQTAIDSQPD